MDVYASCQELYTGLDDRERGPADELPVLAAGCLATAAALSASEQQATEHLLQVSGCFFAFVELLSFCGRGLPGSNCSTQRQPSDRQLSMCCKYEGS